MVYWILPSLNHHSTTSKIQNMVKSSTFMICPMVFMVSTSSLKESNGFHPAFTSAEQKREVAGKARDRISPSASCCRNASARLQGQDEAMRDFPWLKSLIFG